MSTSRRLQWNQAQRDALETLLANANGRRASRLLTWAEVERCATAAIQSALGFAWVTAGDAPDARGVTTICLCAVVADRVTIGVAAGHGAATPANAWSDIPTWDRYRDAANAAACRAWAGRVRPDRIALPLSTPGVSPNATRQDMLAAVLANPQDDAPRLVFADWLSERGDPRGAFISIQCELARGSSRVADLEAEADALLKAHGPQWLEGLDPNEVQVRFRRGFVERAEVRGSQAFAEATGLFEREPVTDLLVVPLGRVIDVELFASSSWVERLRSLEFRVNRNALMPPGGADTRSPVALKPERLGQLLESRHLRELSRLVLCGQRLGDEGFLRLVAQGPASLVGLQSLSVEIDTIGETGIAAFAESRWASRLTEVSFSDNPLGFSGTATLVAARSPGALEKLSLGGCQVGNAGAIAIAGADRFRTLKSLSLPRNRITASGLNALLDSQTLAGLASLDLSGNPLGAAGKRRARARFG